MSFNVALQRQPTPQSPTRSSTSSTDDDVNNPAARVYFGPIQSPEKLLIAQATHKRNNLSPLPVRRSPRLSALQSSQQTASSSGDEGKPVEATSKDIVGPKVAPPSSTPTPDEDSTQDDIDLEPASALATKISRAHDNPSPPPKMQPLDDPIFPAPTEHLPHSASPVLKSSDSAIVDGPSPRVQASVSSPAPREPLPHLDHRPTASASPLSSSTDLIVFDDDRLPAVPKVAPTAEPFPDILAPTPVRQPGPFMRGLESILRTTLSTIRVYSPANEELNRDLTSSKVVTTPPVSNSPATESSALTRHSPRLSPPALQPVHSIQSSLVSPDEVDLPDMHSPQRDTHSSETAGRSVVTEPSRQVRELGSLSPVSEDVLHNLLSTTEAITNAPLVQIPALAPVFPVNQLSRDQPSTPGHQSSPERPSGAVAIHNVQRPPEHSPWRSHIANLGSPSKFSINSALDDPNRTPAQRIPIAQGSASPRKDSSSGPKSGIFGRPVFTRHSSEDRIRSPVRRPDVTKHAMDVSFGIARPTASASPGKVRGGSEEPQFPRGHQLRRPFQRSTSDSEIASPSKTGRIPAFPIRPAVDARLPSTIPEEHDADSPTKPTQSNALFKSALRQPSSMAGSRIPRIGAKPYARPPAKEKQQDKGKEPVHKLFMTKRPTSSGSALTKPVRLVKSVNASGSGSGSSSEDLADSHAATPGVQSNSQMSTSALPQPSPSLKRKRSVKMPSPPPTQPAFARLVTPTSRQSSSSSSLPPAQPQDSGMAVKKSKIGHVRTVGGDNVAQKRAARSPGPQASVDRAAKTRDQPIAFIVSDPSESQIAPSSPPPTLPPALHTTPEQPTPPPDLQTELTSPPEIESTTLPSELDASSFNSPSNGSLSSTTRVTRSRRNPQPTGDVFGPFRPLQPRRRRTAETPGEGTFSSMSALALKALTTSNTTKNQRNLVAVLETEVIRKPGNRPGSPTTRVKTIDEKRKLEQGEGRKERAERRARRASEPLDDSSLTSEDEDSLPLGPDGQPFRHRRGAGEEEDYESPERPERPEKRVRICEAGESGEDTGAKTVKWDRGLFKTVYFDDLPLQSRERDDKPQTPATHVRGALAGSAKALPLDSLGNVVNGTSPLKDLVQENVVIKKFVYDDDAEAVDIDEPKPSSKGKGKKSRG